MPVAQQSVGISSSVAVFLLVISICCVLSLSSFPDDDPGSYNATTTIIVPSYVPNIALICVMLTGITAIVIFICKKEQLTDRSDGCRSTRRHDLHRKYSLYSIEAFFVGVCITDVNYLLVEFSCTNNWFPCRSVNTEYFVANIVLTVFHTVGIVFDVFEVVVCRMMRRRNFKSSQWIWHLLAVVQAANIAMWFHSLLKKSYDRFRLNEEIGHSFDAYFDFCRNTTSYYEIDPHVCTKKSSVAKWFVFSAPILFPITIEFNLLVIETLLDRSIGAESHNFVENAEQNDSDQEVNTVADDAHEPTDRTPLLRENERADGETNSVGSQMFTAVFTVINMVYLVLQALALAYGEENNQSQLFHDVKTLYTTVYFLFLIVCCVVGTISSRRFRRRHSHTNFLEYLLLFATSGILFQCVKTIVAYAVNGRSSASLSLPVAYYMADLVNIVQVLSQITFYYYVKDVRLPLNSHGGNIRRRNAFFKNTIFVISTSNVVMWIASSFLSHGTGGGKPTEHLVESWPEFDSVMIPIHIFFRFNSAMLFWCVYRNLSGPCERDGDDAAVQRRRQAAAARLRYVGDAAAPSHGPTWPINRLRGRPGRRRTRNRPRDEATLL